MLTTAGTIANTGPPPTCMMKIVTQSGQEISSAEIGENLMLQVDVHPTSMLFEYKSNFFFTLRFTDYYKSISIYQVFMADLPEAALPKL